MAVYRAPAEFVDSGHPVVTAKAGELCASIRSRRDAARAVFYFVRDLRYEGGDFEDLEIYRASSVLAAGHGYCVGKAALCTAPVNDDEAAHQAMGRAPRPRRPHGNPLV